MAAKYCQYYQPAILPHVALLDPRTGERVGCWEGMISAKEMLSERTQEDFLFPFFFCFFLLLFLFLLLLGMCVVYACLLVVKSYLRAHPFEPDTVTIDEDAAAQSITNSNTAGSNSNHSHVSAKHARARSISDLSEQEQMEHAIKESLKADQDEGMPRGRWNLF
jgi:hypothetical protein